MNNVKICTKCRVYKPLYEFNKKYKAKNTLRSHCKICQKSQQRTWYKKNIKIVRQYNEINRDKLYLYQKKYVASNTSKRDEWQRNYNKRHPGILRAKSAKYRASKLKRTPKWLDRVQLMDIKRFYVNCPIGYQVDHIIPLRGESVSGLHVPWNLQYLSIKDNASKGNKF